MRSGLLTHTHTQRHLCKVCAPCRISALSCVYAKARSPAHTGVLKQLGICKRKLSAAGAGTRSGWCFQSQNHVFIVQLAKYSAYFTVVLQSRQFSFSSSPDTQQLEMTQQRKMPHPHTKVVLQSRQFSWSSLPDTPRTTVALRRRQFSASSSHIAPRTKVVLRSHQFSASSSPDAVPATKSAHGGSQSAAPATKSAPRHSQSAVPAKKSAHGGAQSAVPATKSAHGGSQSAAPATKSAHGA